MSNSSAAKATVLVPLIGYMILFNSALSQYLDLVNVLNGSTGHVAVSNRLLLLYFGLTFIAVGQVVYILCCPSEVKRFDGPDAYVGHAAENVPMLLRRNFEREMIDSSFKPRLESLRGEQYIPEQFWKAFLHLYYQYLDERRVVARVFVVCAYTVGLVCLAIPSLQVFYRVVMLVISLWT